MIANLTALEQQERLSRWHLEFSLTPGLQGFAVWCLMGLLRAFLCLALRLIVGILGFIGDILLLPHDRTLDRAWSLLATPPYVAIYCTMDILVATAFYTCLPLALVSLILHTLRN